MGAFGNLANFAAWCGGKLFKANWLRKLLRLTLMPGIPGAVTIVAGVHWQMPWLQYVGFVLVAPFVLVFGVIPVLIVLTICGFILLAIGQSIILGPSRRKQLEEAGREMARLQAERAAHKASRGPDFRTGDGQAEPCITLIAPPEEAIDLDPDAKFISLNATIEAVNASKTRRDQRILDQLPLGGSRLGGVPDLPPTLAWPLYKGKKLPFLAQVDLAALPPGGGSLLPADGWLYAFALHDNVEDHQPSPAVVLLHRGDRETLVRAPRPVADEIWPDWTGTAVYEVMPVTGTLGSKASRSGAEDARPRDVGWLFGNVAEMDGTAGSIADDCDLSGDDWIHLMALHSVGSMQWSDCGILYLIGRRSDLAKGDFSSVFTVLGSVG